MMAKQPALNMDNQPAKTGECCWCGKTKPIYAENFVDPYMTELYPDESDDATSGDWCENCWDNRKDAI